MISFCYLRIESERFITSYQSGNMKVIISQGAVKTANQSNHLRIFYISYYYCDYRFEFMLSIGYSIFYRLLLFSSFFLMYSILGSLGYNRIIQQANDKKTSY